MFSPKLALDRRHLSIDLGALVRRNTVLYDTGAGKYRGVRFTQQSAANSDRCVPSPPTPYPAERSTICASMKRLKALQISDCASLRIPTERRCRVQRSDQLQEADAG